MSLTIKEKFSMLQSGETFKGDGHTFKANSEGEVVNELGKPARVGEWGCMVLVGGGDE